MKIERTKNAGRNILFGGILKIDQIAVPFFMRTAMIYFMGVEYLGLNSLFTSILQVLNLAELGVGSAMVYSMYKPIAEDDKDTICSLMSLYRTYYRVIGLVIAVIGIALLPFIPKLIKSDLPADVNIYILYLLNLAVTVLSYWLYAYKNCLLDAHQRMDITSKVSLLTNTVQYGLQIIVLFALRNYYIYVIIALITQAMTNIVTAYITSIIYPEYTANGKLNKDKIKKINQRIKDLFTSKIGAVIVNSADTIVISAFLGLKMLAIYQNYFFILNSIVGCVAIIFTSCIAGIGNSIIVESKEKNFNDLKKFTFIIAWIAGFCTTCLLCLYQPFMDIWVGKELKLGYSAVICFCVYYYIYEMNMLLNAYKDAAGIWHEDRFRPLITALTNLILSVITVNFWGIYGVILSTVVSTVVVGMPWLLHNLFTVLFDRKMLKPYLKKVIFYLLITMISCIVTFTICSIIAVGTKWEFITRILICCVVPNILFFIAYRKRIEFKQSLELLDSLTNYKIKKIKNSNYN